MEKHIIFLYPLHPVIQELKDLLEKEGGYDINEIDDVNEYKQLIGVIGNAITLTSDVKKIHSSLDAQKNLIKNGSSKVIIMGKIQKFPHEVGQLRVMGVQEILPDNTALKSLQFKLNLFLKAFETAEAQKEKERIQEEKKARKAEVKKSVPFFVDNEKEKPQQESKQAENKEESDFDFKEMVKSSFQPLNVRPVEEKKKKSKYSPFRVDQEASKNSLRKTSKGIVFDEASVEESEIVNNDEKDASAKSKGKYNPLRLKTDKEAALAQRKKELEEVAKKLKAAYKPLRLDQGDENVSSTEHEDEEKVRLKKKYNPFKLNQGDEIIDDGEEENEEEKKRKLYKAFKLQSEKEIKQLEKKDKQVKGPERNNSIYQKQDNDPVDDIENSLEESLKDGGFLDYSDEQKEKSGGEYTFQEEVSQIGYEGEEDEEYLHYPEFYWPPSGVSTFIPFLLEILQKKPFSQDKYMQFICFMFFRKLGGQLTYVIERNDNIELLVSTHQLNSKEWKLENEYSTEEINELRSITSPTWSDNTFQKSHIEFVFPFYYNKERLGFAHAIFENSQVKNIQEALEVELLLVTARTVYLKEFGF